MSTAGQDAFLPGAAEIVGEAVDLVTGWREDDEQAIDDALLELEQLLIEHGYLFDPGADTAPSQEVCDGD